VKTLGTFNGWVYDNWLINDNNNLALVINKYNTKSNNNKGIIIVWDSAHVT